MKKIAAFILALFYLCVSTGSTVHVTYCMGKLVGERVLHTNSKKCCKCGMEKNKNNGCCREEFKQFKIDSDQNIPEHGLQVLHAYHIIIFISETPSSNLSSVTGKIAQTYGPYPRSNIAVYKRNCVFLI
jgi:hypothetical protein